TLVSVTKEGSTVSLYENGVLLGAGETDVSGDLSLVDISGASISRIFDALRISSRARTPEEIQASYEAWQQGRWLERDADTTYLLGFDETRIQVEAELTAKDGGVGGEALPPLSAALSVGDQGLGADAPAGGWATTFLFDDGTASEHVIREILAVAI